MHRHTDTTRVTSHSRPSGTRQCEYSTTPAVAAVAVSERSTSLQPLLPTYTRGRRVSAPSTRQHTPSTVHTATGQWRTETQNTHKLWFNKTLLTPRMPRTRRTPHARHTRHATRHATQTPVSPHHHTTHARRPTRPTRPTRPMRPCGQLTGGWRQRSGGGHASLPTWMPAAVLWVWSRSWLRLQQQWVARQQRQHAPTPTV